MFEGFILAVEGFIAAYGFGGIFIISVLESFIFPVPTATIVAPMTALGADPFIVAVIASIGSVIGGLIGYFLGDKIGRPVAEKLFKEKHIKKVEKWYEKYGAWTVLIAAFSPVPFKVFTWFSGICELDIKKFLIASIIGRTAQFFIAAYVGSFVGPWFLGFFGL